MSKILIHQANEKMDEAIIQRFYKLYDRPVPQDIMPMSIHELGNSSVATVPTFDLLIKSNKGPDNQQRRRTTVCFCRRWNECQCICLSILIFYNNII
jgi:hypothetical protein